MNFRAKLVSEIIQMDTKAATKKGHNPYAIGIYLRAVDSCMEMIAGGETEQNAFCEIFTPSREMHQIAKKIGLHLTVERGNWVSTI